MTRWTAPVPTATETLDALATEILHHYSRGRVTVALDGVDGAGKTLFADALAAAIRARGQFVVRASIDDFHRPRSDRHARGRMSAEGYYRDAYDYAAFRSMLLDPFRSRGGEAFVTRAFDHRLDAPVVATPATAPADAILLVDGVFLNRPELKGIWNFSIWLQVPRGIAAARTAERDGVDPADPLNARYQGAQSLYWSDASPRKVATAIVDNTDVEHPRRIFADSC